MNSRDEGLTKDLGRYRKVEVKTLRSVMTEVEKRLGYVTEGWTRGTKMKTGDLDNRGLVGFIREFFVSTSTVRETLSSLCFL